MTAVIHFMVGFFVVFAPLTFLTVFGLLLWRWHVKIPSLAEAPFMLVGMMVGAAFAVAVFIFMTNRAGP